MNSEYVYYYFQTLKSKAEEVASGTTFLELSATKFSMLPFPLAPIQVQQKIVSKIESLFSELEEAEKGLHKSIQQLAEGSNYRNRITVIPVKPSWS